MKKSALYLSLAALAIAAPVLGQQAAGSAKAGAQVYFEHGCHGCHGYNGYGRKDLNGTGSPLLLNEDVFRAFLRGRADVVPLFPVTDMPNYPANSLTDAMVRDLYAFVRSLQPNMPAVESVPVLQAILQSAEQRRYQP